MHLDWKNIFTVNKVDNSDTSLETVLNEPNGVFGSSGVLNGRTVTISVKNNNPRYCKARVPPYAMRDKIEKELERLEQNGIIKRVDSSDWATPIVPVQKKDGRVRICGDYKITVNKEIEQNRYPIPNIEDVAHKLAGGEKFTELDFWHAYTQLKLNNDLMKYTTINTHKGLYQYERLCFGISSSPSIFQAVMDSIFQEIPNVCVYFDNLYITGKDDSEHLLTRKKVLRVVSDKGLKINKDKCQFMMSEINFLGHRLSRDGLKPQYEKVKTIKEAPKPENAQELNSLTM
ncbi:Pol polyprotein [Elysia marginata]|uniref:Pol polyprotein n=1 Tax=Elysia marginata TaxID=1093978 RepID=A0AAV4JAE8_9GAST|nr:Pol polyprotein [Elysia marginata]